MCKSEEGMLIVRRKRERECGIHDPPDWESVQATTHIFHIQISLKKNLTSCSFYWIPSCRSGHLTLSFPGVLPAAGGEYD